MPRVLPVRVARAGALNKYVKYYITIGNKKQEGLRFFDNYFLRVFWEKVEKKKPSKETHFGGENNLIVKQTLLLHGVFAFF